MTDLQTWLLPMAALLPVLLGSFLLAGVPWTLVVLPRADWRDWPTVLALGLALGAALWTAGMFLLGTFATLSLLGTLIVGGLIAITGVIAALWRPRLAPRAARLASVRTPLAGWEWLILGGLALALLLRVINVAYWPFTAYDPLWVYGYNARVFMVQGAIPAEMGYYPQLLPLSYTYGQLLWGGINDHAARAAIPVFALISILGAYALGARLVGPQDGPRGRRIGLLTAALWTFYPHHAEWSHAGDLEVPLTAFFTLAALCFVLAWRDRTRARWRYAILAGLMLGGAMWTKPTAGALVWGIGLVFLIEVVRQRFDVARLRAPFAVVVVTGLATVPLGGMWYLRNLALGHPALVFPNDYWLTQAQRSGQELGWPLLILALLAVWPRGHRTGADHATAAAGSGVSPPTLRQW